MTANFAAKEFAAKEFAATDFAAARRVMVARQLQPRGIKDERVLEAMGRIPRERFLPVELAAEAYDDCALPIDCEQTISQPVIVALMTETLQLTGAERVLEIGTGSGYQTAILAELSREVYSLERHADLSEQAADRLRLLGYRQVHLRIGDGARGWAQAAPFDRVIVTAAAAEMPAAVWEQLAEGGIAVAPLGPASDQVLYQIRKIAGLPQAKALTGCRFVPLVSS